MKKIRDRKSNLLRETLLYGIAAIVFAGLATALWFLQRTIGIAAIAIVCAFALVAIANFIIGLLIYRSFKKLSKDGSAPFAFVNEFGHLELFGGTREDAPAYAGFCVNSYAKMSRPVDENPKNDEIKAAKAEQKKLNAEEKALRAKLTPLRQFDHFSPADLPFLEGKAIFVSDRGCAACARQSDWEAAREKNEIVLLESSFGKTKEKQ